MYRDFSLWLKKNHLEEDYKVEAHKQDIETDFQRETFQSNPNTFVKWMVKFPNQARKYFPQVVSPLEERLSDSSDLTMIGVLRIIIDGFYSDKEKTDGLLAVDKIYSVTERIELIDLALQYEHVESEIISSFISQNKEKLLSYREYWTGQLPSSATDLQLKDKGFESIHSFFEAAHDRGWGFFFKTKNDRDIFYMLLSNHFQGKPIKFPSKVIEIKAKTKTKLARVLRDIYWNNTENTLRTNTEFHTIVRSLKPFEYESDVPKLLGR